MCILMYCCLPSQLQDAHTILKFGILDTRGYSTAQHFLAPCMITEPNMTVSSTINNFQELKRSFPRRNQVVPY